MVTREEAAADRSAAMSSSRRDELRVALGVERAGYVVRGLPDRVAAVDEQIRLLDAEVAPVEDAPASEPAARRRKR